MMLEDIVQKASFQGVPFPVGECPFETGTDGVEHMAYGRDGADCEVTNQKPYRGTLTLPLYADLAGWENIDMFAVARELIGVIGAQPIGELVHPVLGSLTAWVKNVRSESKPEERSGATLTLEWVEHKASVSLVSGQSGETPADSEQAVASRADAADTELAQLVPSDEYTSCRETVATQLTAIREPDAGPTEVESAVRAIIAVVDSNLEHPDVQDVAGANAQLALERLRASALALRDSLLAGGRTADSFTTSDELSVFEIALAVYGDAREAQRLIEANPVLAEDPLFVPPGLQLVVPQL